MSDSTGDAGDIPDMNKLYAMLRQGLDPEQGRDLVELVKLSKMEVRAFDSMVTKSRGMPYYPLSQMLENQKVLRLKYPRGQSAKPEVRRPESYYDKPLAPVKKVDRYSGEEAIGEGGTAVVYRATDNRLKRPVALKRFKEENESNKTDYIAELESASRIRHPNVVSTFDANEDDKGHFIVMELIDGEDLQEMIERGPLPLGQFIDFAIQALEGLLATHDGGLLHLDLKPANLMMSRQASGRNTVKLVDYGRAQVIEDENGKRPTGLGMDGSIYFAAPEQLLSQELDRRTDLYAMGCVFYWALSGKRPFEGDDTLMVMASHLQNTVTHLCEVKPEVPQWLGDWVMNLIRLEKNDRPVTAQDAINRLVDGGRTCEVIRYSS